MKKHADSHLDHGLTEAHVNYLLARFADQHGFFIETIELPAHLGEVPCALYGPVMGDGPIGESVVRYVERGTRGWPSRVMRGAIGRTTRKLTVIAGPHDGEPCVLFTAFGGDPTPQEPGDPSCKDPEASRAFWAVHALAEEVRLFDVEGDMTQASDRE